MPSAFNQRLSRKNGIYRNLFASVFGPMHSHYFNPYCSKRKAENIKTNRHKHIIKSNDTFNIITLFRTLNKITYEYILKCLIWLYLLLKTCIQS